MLEGWNDGMMGDAIHYSNIPFQSGFLKLFQEHGNLKNGEQKIVSHETQGKWNQGWLIVKAVGQNNQYIQEESQGRGAHVITNKSLWLVF